MCLIIQTILIIINWSLTIRILKAIYKYSILKRLWPTPAPWSL